MRKTNLRLDGCTHDPLLNYLKSLGILRIIGTQADSTARGYWSNDNTFNLTSTFEKEQLLSFILNEYVPTPFVSPWNNGGGFYGKTAQKYLEAMEDSTQPRFALYRKTIKESRAILSDLNITEKADLEKQKEDVLAQCRSRLPDVAVDALDAIYMITSDHSGQSHKSVPRYAPIMGSGGNDGNLEFSYTFFKHLQSVVPSYPEKWSEKDSRLSHQRLEKALFDIGSPPLLKDAVGQFYPGGIGGPNSTRGFESHSLVNPWDFVLAFEGAVLLAGAVSRRYSETATTSVSFPFTVGVSAAGWGTLASAEADDNKRGEIWLPLWDKPATLQEISYVFSEGRARVGRRQAVNGVDFARAVAGLGIDRGIRSFHRIGFLAGGRNGNAYLATSLGNFSVNLRPQTNLLDELDSWLQVYERGFKNSSTSSRNALRQVEESMFNYCQHGGTRRLQEVLIALGQASRIVGRSKEKNKPNPLSLSAQWVKAVDDGTAEFRMAAAVASIVGTSDGKIGSIRHNLEPVAWEKGRYVWKETKDSVAVTDLPRTLHAVLERRMLSSSKENLSQLPLAAKCTVNPADIQAYLDGLLDESKIISLLLGLTLVNWYKSPRITLTGTTSVLMLNRCYPTLKLLFLPFGLPWPQGAEPMHIRPEPTILSRLRMGDVDGAMDIAQRRLRSSGLELISTSTIKGYHLDSSAVSRLPGALLIPVGKVNRLAKLVLKPKKGDE